MKNLYTLLVLLIPMVIHSQVIDVQVQEWVVHPSTSYSDGINLDGYITYRLWAVCANADDYVSSVFGINDAVSTINTTTDFWQSSFGGPTVENINEQIVAAIPSAGYDSFITIGKTVLQDPGQQIFTASSDWLDVFEPGGGMAGGNIELSGVFGGSWFTINLGALESINAYANLDHHVLLGQFTTTGTISGCINVQSFIHGNGEVVHEAEFCFDGVDFTADPCCDGEPGDCCSDPNACNYDDQCDLGYAECFYIDQCGDCDGGGIAGCQDTSACNYDSSATCDDGSCFFTNCDGCSDDGLQVDSPFPGFAACNYDPEGTSMDGCEYDSCAGCLDDGSGLLVTAMYPGVSACNFDPLATLPGNCVYDCLGCVDSTACNFDSSASIEDGSCCYGNCLDMQMGDGGGNGWEGATYSILDDNMTEVASGNLDDAQFGDGVSLGLDQLCLPDGCYSITVGGGSADEEVVWSLIGAIGISGEQMAAGPVDFAVGGAICNPGCTDSTACNFDSNALSDDGSCCYENCVSLEVGGGSWDSEITWEFYGPGQVVGVDPPLYLGGAPETQILCVTEPCGYQFVMMDGYGDGWNGATYSFVNAQGEIVHSGTASLGLSQTVLINFEDASGCTDSTASNFDPNALCDDGMCAYCAVGETDCYLHMSDYLGAGWNGATYTITDDIFGNGNVLYTGTLNDGYTAIESLCVDEAGCFSIAVGGGTSDESIAWELRDTNNEIIVAGGAGLEVTPWTALPSNPACNIVGCTDPWCINFNPGATTDDGSCECPPLNNSCSTAIELSCGQSYVGFTYHTEYTGDQEGAFCNGQGSINPYGAWYSFIGDGSAVNLTTCSEITNFDNTIFIYTGEVECSNMECLLFEEDGCYVWDGPGESPNIFFETELDQTYYVLVTGSNQNYEGDFELTLDCNLSNCMDGSACNYNPLATTDDGSCMYLDACGVCGGSGTIAGCIDTAADNYDSSADCDDGSCFYVENPCIAAGCEEAGEVFTLTLYDLYGDGWNGAIWQLKSIDGTFIDSGDMSTAMIPGEEDAVHLLCFCQDGCYTMDVGGGEWDEEISWTLHNESGDLLLEAGAPVTDQFFQVGIGCGNVGCTDPFCSNYNPNATTDDGTCVCPPVNDLCENSIPIACGEEITATTEGSSPNPELQYLPCGVESIPHSQGVWYEFIGIGADVLFSTCDTVQETTTRVTLFTTPTDCSEITCLALDHYGCQNGNNGELEIWTELGTTYYVLITHYWSGFETDFTLSVSCSGVIGCTDTTACNYNSLAVQDDGSCEFLSCVCDACGSDFPTGFRMEMTDSGGNGWEGAQYEISDSQGTIVAAGQCDGAFAEDVFCFCESDCYTVTVGGGSNDSEIGWSLYDQDDTLVASGIGLSEEEFCTNDPIFGCTTPGACNYSAAANMDDGSCSFPGCTDPTALNYDSTAGCDSGLCEYETDLDGDGDVDVDDLLTVLGDFSCMEDCVADVNGDGVVNIFDILIILIGMGG